MLSSMDDYPIHQIAAPVRHVGSSDRNFYDRYYFNLHGSTDELFMVIGMGQYPNLATQDAFACVCSGGKQRVLRASKVLGDRMRIGVLAHGGVDGVGGNGDDGSGEEGCGGQRPETADHTDIPRKDSAR